MSRVCEITGVRAQTGHNVSHSNRKTKRKFRPNVQKVRFASDVLGRNVELRVTTRAVRTVQRAGGLDAFLIGADAAKLALPAARLKRDVHRALSGK